MKTATLRPKRQTKKILNILLKNLIKLGLAGTVIGLLHATDLWPALILGIYMIISVSKRFKKQVPDRHIYLTGLIISSLLGVLCEVWGVYFGHWWYHDLSGGRQFPYWLPFAWGLAFTYIYKLEKDIIHSLAIHSEKEKFLLALLVAMVFPTIGEMITINLGVWTYSWPFQLLGVPLLAIFLLMVFHTGVNFLMGVICKKMGWKDPVFND